MRAFIPSCELRCLIPGILILHGSTRALLYARGLDRAATLEPWHHEGRLISYAAFTVRLAKLQNSDFHQVCFAFPSCYYFYDGHCAPFIL
jgi:hypothetical protein